MAHAEPRAAVGGIGRARPLAAPAAAALLSGAAAVAQVPEEGPVVVSPRPALEPLGFQDFGAAVIFDWRLDVDEQDSAGEPGVRDVENRFREILELSTTAFVGHPNLVELDLQGDFWLIQRLLDFDSTQTSERISETVLDWNASALFLKNQKVPITVYTRQTNSDVDRPFAGPLRQVMQEYGIRFDVQAEKYPMVIELFRRQQDQDDPFGGSDFDTDQYTAQGDGRFVLGARQNLWWDFTYDDVKETGTLQIPQSFQRLQANATHSIDFGDHDQNQFSSTLNFFDQTGDGAVQQLRLIERLRLEHDPSLNSTWEYNLQYIDRPTQRQIANQALARFRHQLFDSLTTNGRLGGGFLDVPTDTFERADVFGDLTADYVKTVPYGQVIAGADLTLSFVDQTDRGQPISVFDEQLMFNAANQIFINQRNVEAGSIVVTDTTGLITFVEGVDYAVVVLPDRVEIIRLPGGAIGPLQTVLVDFDIGPEPGGTIDTFGYGGDIGYRFDETFLRGLYVYLTYFQQDEDRSEELSLEQPDNDFTDLRLGLEYNAWKLYFKAERQRRDSTLSPFDATLLEARYTENLGPGSTLVFTGIYQDLDQELSAGTETVTVAGRWVQRLSDRFWLNLIVQWQKVNGGPGLDSQGFEQELYLNWRYRQTEIYARIRNSILDSTDDLLSQTVIVGVRREF